MPTDPASVDQPAHPVPQLTTSELAAYRRQLESAVAFFGKTQAPALALMKAKLAEVLAEQADRVRLAARA